MGFFEIWKGMELVVYMSIGSRLPAYSVRRSVVVRCLASVRPAIRSLSSFPLVYEVF
jgi:hypothetical protein